jgi:hypothetical protein
MQPFYYRDVAEVLYDTYGVNAAVMKKMCDDKLVCRIKERQMMKRNGQVLRCYQISAKGHREITLGMVSAAVACEA